MLRAVDVRRVYDGNGGGVEALRGVSFEVGRGRIMAITGPSGCGKSTLIHILGALDTPSSGEIWVGETGLHLISERDRDRYRRNQVGIVFQFFNLLPTLSLRENVALPLILQGVDPGEAGSRAREILEWAGLTERAHHFPHQVSGGEAQRAAVCRALIHEPALLLADEPTGNLDTEHTRQVMEMLLKVAEERGRTVILVTHSRLVAEMAHGEIRLRDGRVCD